MLDENRRGRPTPYTYAVSERFYCGSIDTTLIASSTPPLKRACSSKGDKNELLPTSSPRPTHTVRRFLTIEILAMWSPRPMHTVRRVLTSSSLLRGRRDRCTAYTVSSRQVCRDRFSPTVCRFPSAGKAVPRAAGAVGGTGRRHAHVGLTILTSATFPPSPSSEERCRLDRAPFLSNYLTRFLTLTTTRIRRDRPTPYAAS